MENTFKILCIDGGGIKGLYSATILNKIEKQLIKDSGDNSLRIVDYFDLICGTSTGGLIALALSLGVSTDEVCRFYTDYGPKIFKKWSWPIPFLKHTFFFGKYSDKKLRAALEKILKDKKIGDSKCLLCIPTFDLTHGSYEIFKFDHTEGNLSRDNAVPMIDVALATSAAPTFFPIAQIELHDNRQYVDGGVWANNPAIIGYAEAIRHFVGENKPYKNIKLLSVASLNVKQKKAPFARRKKSIIGWRSSLFDLPLVGQSEFADIFLNSLKNSTSNLDYYRIHSSIIDSVHAKKITLDLANKESLTLMKQYGNDMYHKIKGDVKSFFQNKKTYITNPE